MRILINESNADIQRLYQAILAPFYVDITFAHDAEQTECFAEKNNYDLVFVDVAYPVMEGLAISKSLRRKNPDRPVVLVSSVPLRTKLLDTLTVKSSSAVLMKPFDIQQLRALIRQFDPSVEISKSYDSPTPSPTSYLEPAFNA